MKRAGRGHIREKALNTMNFKRKVYFNKVEFSKAKNILKEVLKSKKILNNLGKEKIDIESSIDRITAEPVYAKSSVPPFSTAAMDGISVDYKSTLKALPKKPIILERGKDFEFVNTGYPLKEKFNAVIMIEDINILDEKRVEIFKPVPFYNFVRNIGEDIAEGEMVVPSFFKINAEAVSLMYSAGIRELTVLKKPEILLIPTGDEILERGSELKENSIYETNSIFIKDYFQKWGFNIKVNPIVRDVVSELENVLINNLNNYDLIVFSAGTSSGSKDFIPSLIEKHGKIHFHGVNYIPGKPFCFGEIENKPVFCIPGYPGAAAGVLNEFIEDIAYFFTLYDRTRENIKAYSSFKIFSKLGMKEYIKIKVGKIGEKYLFYPLKRGSSLLKPFVERDGTAVIEERVEGINKGDSVNIEILKKRELLEEQIIFIGSNDFLISELRDILRKYDYTKDIAIINSGSMGGLKAISEKVAHFSGIHLLDMEIGEYNKSFIKKYLKEGEYKYLPFVKREQGFITSKGNPKKIKNIEDLLRDDISFINRQRGAGTRLLLDYLLSRKGIETENIKGYSREVFTHLETGIFIKRREADVGMGIMPVSKILDLEFIPVAEEEYGFLFISEFTKEKNYEILIDLINSKEIKRRAEKLGGYKFLL